jgi:mannitol/fructose-specific phosphotransferase system IIA component (Ntr-type)
MKTREKITSSAMAILRLPTEIEVSMVESVLDDMVILILILMKEYAVYDFTEQMMSLLK